MSTKSDSILAKLRRGRLAYSVTGFLLKVFPVPFVKYSEAVSVGVLKAQETLLERQRDAIETLQAAFEEAVGWYKAVSSGNVPLGAAYSVLDVNTVQSGRLHTYEILGATNLLAFPNGTDIREMLPDLSTVSPRALQYSTYHLAAIATMLNAAQSNSREEALANLGEAMDEADRFVWTIEEVAEATGQPLG